ncbi:hypothetical protein LIPSTDRAFT_1888 [Lipomyces starkeyi NRRL Y-11557]|uniref:Uncharacterized protein n=1 Tax=Lipomyces starkeyi NRRL Y-11557 TaxID=675824 RepID=A0A1E3QBW4_LIPST|nr:hypothetical protein LIPSTDRAFT_1888 [Lipomyces starkeyi NRRL Y-11557]
MNSNTPSPTSIHTTTTLGNAKRAGRDGSQNFSVQDKMALLDAIEMVKPLGPAKWEQVLDAERQGFARCGRHTKKIQLSGELPEAYGRPYLPTGS